MKIFIACGVVQRCKMRCDAACMHVHEHAYPSNPSFLPIYPILPHLSIIPRISFSLILAHLLYQRRALAVPVDNYLTRASLSWAHTSHCSRNTSPKALPLFVDAFLSVCHAVSSLVTRRNLAFFPVRRLGRNKSSVPIERCFYYASVVLELQ